MGRVLIVFPLLPFLIFGMSKFAGVCAAHFVEEVVWGFIVWKKAKVTEII